MNRLQMTSAFVFVMLAACNSHDGMGGMDMAGHGAGMPAAPAMIAIEPWTGTLETPAANDKSPASDVVEIDLRAAPGEVEYLPGKRASAWVFNGQLPGPAIRAKVGDEIVVHFTNALPEPTSIHWHGMRVPNGMDGAGPAAPEIPPGGSFDYRFRALDAGTYWYHPHVQASAQVDMGLYGSIVIEDPAGPSLPVAREDVLVLDDVLVDPSTGSRATADEMRVQMMGLEGNLALVNGRRSNVELATRAGELHRWRIVNAANARYFRLGISGGTLIRIGGDGGLLPAPEKVSEVLLVPGERVDVVARVDSPSSTAVLTALPYERAGGAGATASIDLVRLVATDAPAAVAELPPSLRSVASLGASTMSRTVTLSERMADMRTTFLMNGAAYPDVPTLEARLSTVEEWTITNDSDMDHPFHLHGFFFQPDGRNEWKDTINVARRTSVKLLVDLSPREGAAGAWMYHCHILEHAERGMLAELRVQ